MPVISPLWGSVNVRSRVFGDVKGTLPAMGRSDMPLFLGSTAPFATKATSPSFAKIFLRAS